MTVRVRAYSRLHVALIDLGHATGRRYGGAGFTLASPHTDVSATPGDRWLVEWEDEPAADTRESVDRLLAAAAPYIGGRHAAITIGPRPPEHVGLGSRTALLLAVLHAISEATQVGLTRDAIWRLSGRGGTSGIGINSFYVGGFLTDGGQPADDAVPFAPSRVSAPHEHAPLICHMTIPDEWTFHLLLAGDERRWSGKDEADFFAKNTPTGRQEALETIAAIYHGVVPAVASGDLAELATRLWSVNSTGFKGREVANQSSAIRDLMNALASEGIAAGLSSMGPLVYAIGPAKDDVLTEHVRLLAERNGVSLIESAAPRNASYDLIS